MPPACISEGGRNIERDHYMVPLGLTGSDCNIPCAGKHTYHVRYSCASSINLTCLLQIGLNKL